LLGLDGMELKDEIGAYRELLQRGPRNTQRKGKEARGGGEGEARVVSYTIYIYI